MKKIMIIILFLLIATISKADDTAALQAHINAGNYKGPSGQTYTVTSLTMNNSFDANGAKINCQNTAGGCIVFPSNVKKKKFSNAELMGLSDITNTSGATGVRISSDSDTVANVRIHKFTNIGIQAVNINCPVILNSNVYDTGYIGVFVINTSFESIGPVLFKDTIDRSMIPANLPTNTTQACLQIKGAIGDTIRKTTVMQCVFKGIYRPVDWTAECFELRFATDATISKNIVNNGSIGISIVYSKRVAVVANYCTNQQLEAIEYASAQNGFVENNSISNQVSLGILFDTNATGNTIINNNIRGCPGYAVQFSTSSSNNAMIGNVIATTYRAVYMAGVNHITFFNNTFTGGTIALFIENSTGDARFFGDVISGFSSKAVYIYGNQAIKTDNVMMTGVFLLGTSSGLGTVLSNGASLGNNIHVN